MKALRAFIILLVIVVVIFGGGYLYVNNYYNSTINAKNGDGKTVNIVVPSGATTTDISKVLADNKLITNEFIFSLYVKNAQAAPKFKAGTFQIPNNDSMVEIVNLLTGNVNQQSGIRITIIEGLRHDEISQIIATKFQVNGVSTLSATDLNNIIENPQNYTFPTDVSNFLTANKPAGNNLEGFVFPDTYEFFKTDKALDILTKILHNFITRTKNLEGINKYSFYQNLILASIVQRESGPNDYSGVAGVFLNRLRLSTYIGSDTTLLYYLKRWSPEPSYYELKLNTPYNTRNHLGFTPTPISNPGFAAIQGVLSSTPSSYLYFIADKKGVFHYAATYQQHQRNIQKYLN